MQVEAVTRKRGRPPGGRAFDHDEASRMRLAGMTYVDIAKHFGVHKDSVRMACIRTWRATCTDEQWRALEAWIDRRHGAPGGYSHEQIRSRTVIPRVTP